MHRKVLRRLIQGVFLALTFLIPVMDILRFDILTKELYLFGQVWSFAHESSTSSNPMDFLTKGVFPLFLSFISLPISGIILGRLFCGWFCPTGAILESADFLAAKALRLKSIFLKKDENDHRKELLSGIFYLLLCIIGLISAGAFLSGFLISPTEIWRQIRELDFSGTFIITLLSMMFLIVISYAVAQRLFCNYICLGGIAQMIPSIASPVSLRVRFIKERARMCTNCKGCERACFMGIKPRILKNASPRCVNCGECITACEKELGENRLFQYGFGPGKKQPRKELVIKQREKGAS